jgi:hypothetical protein
VAGDLPRIILESAVVRGLTAAGLVEGHPNVEPQSLEQPNDGHPDVGIELVDEARVKQLNRT